MTAPTQAITNALATGSILTIRFAASFEPSINRPPYRKIKPTAVKVAAKPKLKTSVKINPYPIRCIFIAESIKTSADGHGSKPPEMPSAKRLPQVIFSGGKCVWVEPPCVCVNPSSGG